jgi:RNA polymerase sigma-32 factor
MAQLARSDDDQTRRAVRGIVRAAMRAPLRSREREYELALAWRDRADRASLHELICDYGRFVVSTATRFRHYGLPLGDLIQEGNLGLLQAARRFEPARGVRFATYAAWWIRAHMQDFVLRNWSIVRTGTTSAQKSLFFNLRRLRARIDSAGTGPMSAEQRDAIARKLQVAVVDVERMEARLAAADQSLNAPIRAGEDDDWQDTIADQRPTPEEAAIDALDTPVRLSWLTQALAELSPRERAVIHERRLRDDAVTLQALGGVFGVSKERVRQIEQRAFGKLRAAMLRRAAAA